MQGLDLSVTDAAEKRRTMSRLTPNLATIEHLLKCNGADFRVAISRSTLMADRRCAWRRMVRRRRRAVPNLIRLPDDPFRVAFRGDFLRRTAGRRDPISIQIVDNSLEAR